MLTPFMFEYLDIAGREMLLASARERETKVVELAAFRDRKKLRKARRETVTIVQAD